MSTTLLGYDSLAPHERRADREAEGARLLSEYRSDPIWGSNPQLSARTTGQVRRRTCFFVAAGPPWGFEPGRVRRTSGAPVRRFGGSRPPFHAQRRTGGAPVRRSACILAQFRARRRTGGAPVRRSDRLRPSFRARRRTGGAPSPSFPHIRSQEGPPWLCTPLTCGVMLFAQQEPPAREKVQN